MAIDVWAQIPTERMASAPWLQTLLRWRGADAGFVSTPQSTLAAMDAGGIETAFLSAWYGPEGPLITNEEVAAQIEAAPGRFRGLASADLRDPMGAVRELRKVPGRGRALEPVAEAQPGVADVDLGHDVEGPPAREDDAELRRLLALGAEKAREASEPTLGTMYERMGFARSG